MKKQANKLLMLALLLVITTVMTLVACSQETSGGDETTEPNESVFVPETTPGAQLIAAGALEAMILKDGWKVKGDPEGVGKTSGWYKNAPTGIDITIPGSLDETKGYDSEAWFSVEFDNKLEVSSDQRVYLELSGAGYVTEVWLNGIQVGSHKGSFGTFALDVTDAMKYDESNVLYIYSCCPTDGFIYNGVSGKSLPTSYTPRISSPVYLYVKPEVSIKDMFVNPSTADGTLEMTVTVNNAGSSAVSAVLGAKVHENGKTMINDRNSVNITVPAGESVHHISLQVEDFRYWDTDSPVLYNVIGTLSAGERTDEYTVRTGFKDLRVDNEGYFTLNGKRFFMKCTHTSLHVPGTISTAKDIGQYYEMLLYLKSCGFNTIRYIRTAALPEIAQMCDEIGLLLYEEHNLSWLKTDCEKTPTLFEESITDVLLRDRNHVSLGIFGMLNETKAEGETIKLFNAAVDVLPKARAIAPDVLFLLSSGRWDGYLNIGSASNPGSTKWDGYMGAESATNNTRKTNMIWSWMPGLGDVHYYPYLPHGQEERTNFEKIANYPRAVFISEAGMGSQANIINDYLMFEQYDFPKGGNNIACLERQIADFRVFYEDFGLDRVWATPEALLKASEEYMVKQRRFQITMIRRNGNYNGYSLTMSHDAGFRGEGLLEGANSLKPGVTEMLKESLNDLRFCISLKESHIQAGKNAQLEVVISDFEILKDGKKYDVVVRITGKKGTMWEKKVTVTPGNSMTIKVVDESISTTDWETGTYTVGAEMLNGAHPTCGTYDFYVTNTDSYQIDNTVTLLNVTSTISNILTKHGATVVKYTDAKALGKGTLFVGATILSASQIAELYEAANNGAHIVFLSPNAITGSGYPNVPFRKQGTLQTGSNWLYHFDNVVYENSITSGLQTDCIWDNEYYYGIYSNDYYTGISLPTDISVLTFWAGVDGGSDHDFISGIQLGTYAYGEGHITLNTLNLINGSQTPAGIAILCRLANYVEDPDAATGPRYSGEKPESDTVVNFNKGTIKLDGKVDEGEWGTPVLKGVDFEQANADDKDLLTSSKKSNATYDLYMAYDDKYIYAATVLHGVPAMSQQTNTKWAAFGIMFSRYANQTTVPHITYQGQEYEQYVHIRYYLKANGKVSSEVQNEGVDWIDQVASDYKATYDSATETVTFEVRIPVSQSNIKNLTGGSQIAVSSFSRYLMNGTEDTGCYYQYGKGITNSRGAGKTPMKDAAGILYLGSRS